MLPLYIYLIHINYGQESSMQPRKSVTMFIVILVAMLSFAPSHAGEIHVSAAASMTNLLQELTAQFAATHPDVTVVPNLGSSGSLAKQIQQGAPADIFISANTKWMNMLVDDKMIVPDTHATFAYNSLVFVGKDEKAATSLADLPRLARIGIGTPKSVPAGQYASQALQAADLYDRLLKSGKLVMAKDVRQALIYADRGETDGSFVYKTDALLATSAKILFEVPQNLYDTVAYPIGLTTSGATNPDARGLYEYIVSPEAKSIITRHGFSVTQP